MGGLHKIKVGFDTERYFSVGIESKRGNIFGTCSKDNIIGGILEYKEIRLKGFYYKFFEEEEGGWVRKGIYGYPYLNHTIDL